MFSYCILINTIQSTNKELTEVAHKVALECQCDSFNVMAIVSIEAKGNNIAILTRFLVYEVHETDAQGFIMKMVELVKATNIMHVNPRENMWKLF